jgi:hypothetical protein
MVEARGQALEPKIRINLWLLELQTAKEILAEVFIIYRYYILLTM